MTTRPTPSPSAVPANPFATWQLSMLDPGDRVPLVMLLQAAVTGTVDDEITEHAEFLFEELDERGLDAWRDAAVILVQFLLSGGHYGMGTDAAARYRAAQPVHSPDTPSLNLLHAATATYIAEGRAPAEAVLRSAAATDDVVRGACRLLFCIAVGASGYPKGRHETLLSALCGGVR